MFQCNKSYKMFVNVLSVVSFIKSACASLGAFFRSFMSFVERQLNNKRMNNTHIAGCSLSFRFLIDVVVLDGLFRAFNLGFNLIWSSGFHFNWSQLFSFVAFRCRVSTENT